MQMIPRVIHQIWLGNKAIPDYMKSWMETWRRDYPSWEHRLWTDADVKTLWTDFTCVGAFEANDNPGLRSDILRLEILKKFGGLYTDCDFESFESMDHLLRDNEFHYGDEWSGRPSNAWMCSPPNHQIPILMLNQIKERVSGRIDVANDWQSVVRATGPEALFRVLNYWVGYWVGETLFHNQTPIGVSYPGKVTAFWQETLYPYHYCKEIPHWSLFNRSRYPTAMAAHHWAGTWK